MKDSYTLTVVFTRLLSEDEEMARKAFPNDTLEMALRRQLAKELQASCDDAGMAGDFDVVSCRLDHSEPHLDLYPDDVNCHVCGEMIKAGANRSGAALCLKTSCVETCYGHGHVSMSPRLCGAEDE